MSNAGDYKINKKGVLTKYTGIDSAVTIPEEVTAIGSYAFGSCDNLQKVLLPERLTSIGDSAFYYRKSLQSVNIPNKVTHIGNNAFGGCQSLSSIAISENVSSIGEGAFSACKSLMSITIPDGVTTIRQRSFWYCSSLHTITLPKSLESIGDEAFMSCNSLVSIELPEKVSSIGTQAFGYCNNLKSVRIVGALKKIDARTFYACNQLQAIIAPHSVFEVFKQAKLQVVAAVGYLGNSEEYTDLEIISDYQKYIGSQKKILLPLVFAQDMVQGIKAYAKANKITAKNVDEEFLKPAQAAEAKQCVAFLLEWKNKNISEDISVKGISQDFKKDPFNATNMKKLWNYIKLADGTLEITGYKGSDIHIVLPERIGKEQVSSVGEDAFSTNKPGRTSTQRKVIEALQSVIIPEGIINIGANAFWGCQKLSEITIPSSVQSIGEGAFYGCESIASIAIPERVKCISKKTFMRCTNLENIILPNELEYIAPYAFSSCRSLANVSVPPSVTDIGSWAFECCSHLRTVDLPMGITTLETYIFSECSSLFRVIIPESVTTIKDGAFAECSALADISIPDSVSSIGVRAFEGCEKLSDSNGFVIINNTLYDYCGDDICVKIPEGVEIIDEAVFSSHPDIVRVILPDSLRYIGQRAFAYCNIEEILIPQSVQKIAPFAFLQCRYLKKIIVPNTTELGRAFAGCDLLTNENRMIIINSVLDDGGISMKKKIIIPDGVKTLAADALWECARMEELVIPESVEKIGSSLYSGQNRRTVTVIGKDGSYAETWAKENNIPFVAE